MMVMPSGMTMLVSAVHSRKALYWIDETEDGMTMPLKDEQPSNAYRLIHAKLLGKVMFWRDEQS